MTVRRTFYEVIGEGLAIAAAHNEVNRLLNIDAQAIATSEGNAA